MDNQHQQISGYRDLSQNEIDMMNAIKAKAEECRVLVDLLRLPATINTPDDQQADQRWVSIGATQLQQGFMALVRSVAKPTTF